MSIMKKSIVLFLLPFILSAVSCNGPDQLEQLSPNTVRVLSDSATDPARALFQYAHPAKTDPLPSPEPLPESEQIKLSSPKAEKPQDRINLTSKQRDIIRSGNSFALRCLKELGSETPDNLFFSPLSLSYALAMVANGVEGTSRSEILEALGLETGALDDLNAVCSILLKQLPAVDTSVRISAVDAMMVADRYNVKDSFRKCLEGQYFAPVESMPSQNQEKILHRINEWVWRNTGGLVYPIVTREDITGTFVAAIMNTLYFKAPWKPVGTEKMPERLFNENTQHILTDFYLDGGGSTKHEFMNSNPDTLPYAKMDGYQAVAIPYGNGRFRMLLLLPDEVGGNGLAWLRDKMDLGEWTAIHNALTTDWANVFLYIPKFSVFGEYRMNDLLQALGIRSPFRPSGDFSAMFEESSQVYLNKVLQKARIFVSEWGTEAGTVTLAGMADAYNSSLKTVQVRADHPFLFVIEEETSGAILFAGEFCK